MDNDFDWACRRLSKLAPVQLFSWLLTQFTEHLVFAGWEDTRSASLPGVPQGVRDTIARLREALTHRFWILLLEFQLEPDPDMFGRLLIYLGTAWLELRPDDLRGSRFFLAASVVNLTGTPQSLPASYDMVLPGPDGVRCTLMVRERYLQEEEALPLLRSIQSGAQGRILLPFIPAMRVDNLDEAIRLWLELWHGETDPRMQNEVLVLTRVFLELSADRDRWRKALEGLGMKKSAFLEEVRQEARREALLEGEAQTILRQLQLKFPGQVPADLVSRIEQTRDKTALDRWTANVLTADSLEAFRRDSGV